MDAYWRAANYLSVGQIYLCDNPLLKQTLSKEHIKSRLLGHWETTPGLSFIYVHLNRLIKKHDLNMIYITGPGHGGPGLVANAYLPNPQRQALYFWDKWKHALTVAAVDQALWLKIEVTLQERLSELRRVLPLAPKSSVD